MIIKENYWACSQEGKEREGERKKNSRNDFIEKIEMYTKLWAR